MLNKFCTRVGVWAHSSCVSLCHLATRGGTKICLTEVGRLLTPPTAAVSSRNQPGAKLTPGPARTRELSGGSLIFVLPIKARTSRTNSLSPAARSNAGPRPVNVILPHLLNASPAAIDFSPSDLDSTAVNYKSGQSNVSSP